jgi:hypothetical protein
LGQTLIGDRKRETLIRCGVKTLRSLADEMQLRLASSFTYIGEIIEVAFKAISTESESAADRRPTRIISVARKDLLLTQDSPYQREPLATQKLEERLAPEQKRAGSLFPD